MGNSLLYRENREVWDVIDQSINDCIESFVRNFLKGLVRRHLSSVANVVPGNLLRCLRVTFFLSKNCFKMFPFVKTDSGHPLKRSGLSAVVAQDCDAQTPMYFAKRDGNVANFLCYEPRVIVRRPSRNIWFSQSTFLHERFLGSYVNLSLSLSMVPRY